MNDNKAVAGVNLGRMWGEHGRIDFWLRELLSWAADGRIAPRVDRIFPFSEAAAAHRRLEERRNVGKVLLAPDPALL
jgi:NADPH:quinone reductase-like Zn-dependent oxidoreductase